MTTALEIIKSAMRKVGVLSKGENPANDEATEALQTLNDLLSSWSNDSLIVYSRTTESFALSGGVASYTIGTGGTFNTSRPTRIISAYVTTGGVDYPLDIITAENYADITLKTTQGIPCHLKYDNNYPLATIALYPVPTGGTLYILSEKPLSPIASLSATVDLPSGWARTLIYNLAVDLSSEYGQPVSPEIFEIAKESKSEIKHAVMVNEPMHWTTEVSTGRNIYSGWAR